MAATLIDRHFMELLTPKQATVDLEADFAKFQERYGLFLDHDYVICLTDNPMGNLSYTGPETLSALDLPTRAENLMVHLNTFHRKTAERYDPMKEQNEQDLDLLVQHYLHLGGRYLLVVSGDGSERLPRLKPEDLGLDPAAVQTVTSVQLLEYLERTYPGRFVMGAAFNHYEPAEEELEKFRQKLAAGARFFITQPVVLVGRDPRLAAANELLREMIRRADDAGAQVILEVWISQKLAHLLPECIGHEVDFAGFEPFANLRAVREAFPTRRLYLSMVFGPQTLEKVEALL